MKLPPSIHILERGWLSSNNVLFTGKQRTALVDTGYCTHQLQTLSLVQHVLKARPLDAIYNTHLHSDHCGGNRILQQHYPAVRTYVPAAEFARVNNWSRMKPTFAATGQHCEEFRAHAAVHPDDDIELGDLTWRALYAPGHHPYSYILFNQAHGILISADALWEKGFGVVFPALDGYGGFKEVRATLDLIDDLSPAIVIPGHGRPFTDVKAALREAYSRIGYLEEDPKRNAQHGIKVLLKFLLMERQRIKLTEVPELISKVPLIAAANRNYMNYGTIHLAHWVITQLRRTGAAMIDNEFLVDSEPNR